MLEKKKYKTHTCSCNQSRLPTGVKNIAEIDDSVKPQNLAEIISSPPNFSNSQNRGEKHNWYPLEQDYEGKHFCQPRRNRHLHDNTHVLVPIT